MTVNGEVVELDNEGYLLKPKEWIHAVAGQLAGKLGIDMTQDHWFVVNWRTHEHSKFPTEEAWKAGLADLGIGGRVRLRPVPR